MEKTEENKSIEPLENNVKIEFDSTEEIGSNSQTHTEAFQEKAESEFFEFTAIETIEHVQVDYSILDKSQILNQIDIVLNSENILEVKDQIEDLKSCFYKIHKTEVDSKRLSFIENGGNDEDFKFEDELEIKFKETYRKYKEKKIALSENVEKEKQENLKKRWAIIEELKELLKSTESVNKTFNEFKDIQFRWRSIGMVPQSETNNIWESYHHHVGNFYDFVKINNDLRDIDLKKNFDLKNDICLKAELLLQEDSVLKAFADLQKLHDQWREIGPVSKDKKNDLWERFKSITTQINKRHQDYFITLKTQETENLNAKIAVCEKIETFVSTEIKSTKEWIDKTNEVIELQKLWKLIGYAPRKSNNELFNRYRKACDDFFLLKRSYFAILKNEEDQNIKLRLDLCIQAEGLQSSTDWKTATSEFIALQNEWKLLGQISHKESDKYWKRFRTACDVFFNEKTLYYKELEKEQDENLKKKQQIITQINDLVLSDDNEGNLLLLQDIQKEWNEIGYIPLNQKEKTQNVFREAINKKFESLGIDDEKKKFLRYKVKMETASGNRNVDSKISFERTKLHKRSKELQEEIALLENNIGFFAKSKNAESIINEQNNKIEKLRGELDLLHKQTKLLDEIERNEAK
jgi:hypothetical protein